MVKGISFGRSNEQIQEPLLRPLFNDLVECEELLKNLDSEFARRTYIRSSFAFIDSTIFWFRGARLTGLLKESLPVTVDKARAIALLSEELGRVEPTGKIGLEPNRIPFKNYAAFVLRQAAEYAGLDPAPLFSDSGWGDFQIALKVRHRITHPKTPEDCSVSDSEMGSVREAHRWLINGITWIVGGMKEKFGGKEP